MTQSYFRRPHVEALVAILILGMALRMAAAFLNPGFFAVDDYQSMLDLIVPASEIPSFSWVIENSELRSPWARLPLYFLAKLFLYFGITDPMWQIRLVYAAMGVTSLSTPVFAFLLVRDLSNVRIALFAAALCSFHFLMPFLGTRVMFESLCQAPLIAFVYFLWRTGKGHLVSALLAPMMMTLAIVFRPQVGVLSLLIPYVLLLNLKTIGVYRRTWILFFASSAILFVGLGVGDYFARGRFHDSLLRYFTYNLSFSHMYGSKPWYFYIPLSLALIFVPFSLSHMFDWRKFKEHFCLTFLWVAFLVFLIAHSVVEHKEERFLIPALPILLSAASPFFATLLPNRKSLFGLRFLFILSVNVLLLLGSLLSVSQNNVIGLVRYMASQNTDLHWRSWRNSVGVFPKAYASRTLSPPVLMDQRDELPQLTCNDRLVIREDWIHEVASFPTQTLARFGAGPIEDVLSRLNPGKNARRSSIVVLAPAGCSP